MEFIADFLEFIGPYFEIVRPHLVDIVSGLVLLLSFAVGFFKPWRGTLLSLLLQWLCLAIGFFAAWQLAPTATELLLGIEAITGFFEFLTAEQLRPMLSSILVLLIGISLFSLIASVVFAVSKNRNWDSLIFPKKELPKTLGKILSGTFSLLHAYTYVFFFLGLMALPMFNIIQDGSLASTAVNANFIANPLLDTVAEPFVELHETLVVFEELEDLMDGHSIDYYRVAEVINEDPERLAELAETLQYRLPNVSDDLMDEFEAFVSQEGVTPQEVREFFLSHIHLLD